MKKVIDKLKGLKGTPVKLNIYRKQMINFLMLFIKRDDISSEKCRCGL